MSKRIHHHATAPAECQAHIEAVLSGAFAPLFATLKRFDAVLAPWRKLIADAPAGMEQLRRDVDALVKHGVPEDVIDEMDVLHIRIKVAAEIEAESQIWRTFRQLRAQLEAAGMSEADALERIRRMTHDELAQGNASTRDKMIARMVAKHGRDEVRRALNLSADGLKSALKRARKRVR